MLSDQLNISARVRLGKFGAWNGIPNASPKTNVPKRRAQNPPQMNATSRFFQNVQGRSFQRRSSQRPYTTQTRPNPASPTIIPNIIGKANENTSVGSSSW